MKNQETLTGYQKSEIETVLKAPDGIPAPHLLSKLTSSAPRTTEDKSFLPVIEYKDETPAPGCSLTHQSNVSLAVQPFHLDIPSPISFPWKK